MKPIEPAISGHKVVSDPSLPGAGPRSDRPRCGGRESDFLAVDFLAVMVRAKVQGDRQCISLESTG